MSQSDCVHVVEHIWIYKNNVCFDLHLTSNQVTGQCVIFLHYK